MYNKNHRNRNNLLLFYKFSKFRLNLLYFIKKHHRSCGMCDAYLKSTRLTAKYAIKPFLAIRMSITTPPVIIHTVYTKF